MSFKNPLDEKAIKKIAEIATETFKTYTVEYMKAFKDCLIENLAEGKKEEKPKEVSPPIDFIVANITNADTKSKAGKKYTAYNTQIVLIKTRGSSFKSVPIRYSEFRKFNEQAKNKLKNLPAVPPKKMFNKLDKKTVEERQSVFQTYLKALTGNANIHTDELAIKFFKLKAEGENKYSAIYKKAFMAAYKATCAAFKKKPYSDVSSEVDALTELVYDQVNSDLKPEMEKNLPQDPKLHSMAVSVFETSLGIAVDKAVQAAWAGISGPFDSARKSLVDVFESKTQIVVEANNTVKTKIESAVSKVMDPAIDLVTKVAQQVGYPISKGITVMSQDLAKQKQNTIAVISAQVDNPDDDKKFSEMLLAQVGNFKKATSSLEEAVKLAASAGKGTFPILGDVGSIFNAMVDIVSVHFEIIATAIAKIFVERTWAEKELSKDSTRNKFNEVVDEMQIRLRKIISETVSLINKKAPDVAKKAAKAFEKYPDLGAELGDFISKLPCLDLDALETFRQELGTQAKSGLAQVEESNKAANFVQIFRKALRDAAHITVEIAQGEALSALNDSLRETVKRAALHKLVDEIIPQCLELASPISDAIPAILKDMGFDLPQIVADVIIDKAGEGVDKIMDSVQESVLENLKEKTEGDKQPEATE